MKYTGGCHCGEVRFEVEMEIKELVSCNCSICSKRGHLLAFTSDEKFRLISGENSITDYQFGKKSINHYFCKFCGIGAFGKGSMPDGTPVRSVNARCLDDVDIGQFPFIDSMERVYNAHSSALACARCRLSQYLNSV